MLDIECGIFPAENTGISKLIPSIIPDVIESAIILGDSETISKYSKDWREHIVKFAIRYDKPEFLKHTYRVSMRDIIKHSSARCLEFLLNTQMDLAKYEFWSYYDGRSKELYEAVCKVGSFIDELWIQKAKSGYYTSKMWENALNNVVGWIPLEVIMANVHRLKNISHIVMGKHHPSIFVREFLLNPSQALCEFIITGTSRIYGDSALAKVTSLVHEYLNDDSILSEFVRNVPVMRGLVSQRLSLYSIALEHEYVRKVIHKK